MFRELQSLGYEVSVSNPNILQIEWVNAIREKLAESEGIFKPC